MKLAAVAAVLCLSAVLGHDPGPPDVPIEESSTELRRPGPQPIPRGYHHAPEGTSLRSLIGTVTTSVPDGDSWQIFYDEGSGHPYYFNKVRYRQRAGVQRRRGPRVATPAGCRIAAAPCRACVENLDAPDSPPSLNARAD